MSLDVGDIEKFNEVVKRIDRVLDRMGDSKNIGTANVNINAGGVAVWIAVTCCVAMLAATMVGAVWLGREFGAMESANHQQDKRISDLNDYLSAIYMQAPQLRPKEEKK
ncbi:hypothetical protein ISN75_06900 [Dyella marensis]|uniref:hypothetical protein n=1 Tax=Dyella marensis TaxID=500610 RepID=UPI0031DBD599